MKDFELGYFKAVLSEVVTREIEDAPGPVQMKYRKLIENDAEILRINEEALDVVLQYQTHKILPHKFTNDMLHIALATVAGVDILVSWNFKHIVHFDKIRQFNAVNNELGYKGLSIYSPMEVTNYGKD